MRSAKTKQIDIDVDVNGVIEKARTSFDESSNDILRRLLGIDPHTDTTSESLPIRNRPGWHSNTGVYLPNGTELTMSYNSKQHFGIIRNGLIKVRGGTFKSLSGAASFLANKNLNGWTYWRAKLPGEDKSVSLRVLRARARRKEEQS